MQTRLRPPSRQIVKVDGVGIFYFPTYLSDVEMEEQMHSVYAKAAALQLPNAQGRFVEIGSGLGQARP
jgi:hypothetical protein